MSRFQFPLESLLLLRRNTRDEVLQQIAQALQVEELWIDRENATTGAQGIQIDELRQLSQPGQFDIDRAASRRYHAGILAIELQLISQHRGKLAEILAKLRDQLAIADQEVRLLEKLRDKQLAEFNQRTEKRAEREREEAWLGSHWSELNS